MANHFLAAHFPKAHFVGAHFPPPASVVVVPDPDPPPQPESEISGVGGSALQPTNFPVRNRRLKRLIYEEEIRDAIIRDALDNGEALGPLLQSGSQVEVDLGPEEGVLQIASGSRTDAGIDLERIERVQGEIARGHNMPLPEALNAAMHLESSNLRILARKAIRFVQDEEELFFILIASDEL